MNPEDAAPAAIALSAPGEIILSGNWTALRSDALAAHLDALRPAGGEITVDGTALRAFDTVGAWLLQTLLARLQGEGHATHLRGFIPRHAKLAALAAAPPAPLPAAQAPPGLLESTGRGAAAAAGEAMALLGLVGETATVAAGSLVRPARMRWRPILFNIRASGFDALPIVGLLSFLLGVVIAYQAADQLRRYGANIFVADLVGLSVLREFAPLVTAIIVAGRSGSAYAAQIGSMSVTNEIDAMRTIGIDPVEMLVLPKLIALMLAMPLLTFFADLTGVFGGMVMARAQLDVGYDDFLDRFVKAVDVTALMIGIGKAPVFAAIIVSVGCLQGFRTSGGGADSVGRQTTRAVVQSIFLVIVADALFSVLLSILGL